ncbi:hypothetical protein GOB93_14760 [Acetobacter musti]|uniref:Phage tail tape measure protein domain-containing protein n=1 Tax=Acetobacter musti TaxID=864732 RepID=A0ABX0JSU3_9PROT|nr:hypothetical protein [Acetobacter musti]NHN85894.1 hypothetical protein [Acetobacter musti]
MPVEAYQIGISLKADADGVLSALGQMLKAFERINKAQNETNIGTREIVSGLRGATRSALSLADAYDRVAQACQRAARASSRVRAPQGGGGFASDDDEGTERPGRPRRSSSSSGGQLVPLSPGRDLIPYGSRDLYLPSSAESHSGGGLLPPPRPSGYQYDWSWLGGDGDQGTSQAGGRQRGSFPRHDLQELGFGIGAAGIGAGRLVGSADARGFTTDTLLSVLGSDNRITPSQLRSAYNAAYNATNSAPGTRLNTNLEALIDLTNVTGNVTEAMGALPAFAKMTSRLQAISRQHGGDGDAAYAAAKAMDIMGGMIDDGQVNPALMQHRLDLMTRVAVATNDRVDPRQYLGFAKQARSAGMMLSDQFTYEELPAIIQNIGGQRAGTALVSLSQVFEGGRMTDKSYDALAAIGLAPRRRGKRQGRVYDLNLLGSDPLEWMQHAQRRMNAAGIHGTTAQMTALSNASQRSTIAGLLADLLKDMPAILRDRERIRHTDISGMDRNAAAAVNSLSAAWDQMLTVAGNSNTKDAITAVTALTNGLNALGDAEKKHPNMARMLTDLAIGIGAVGVAAGAALVAIGPLLALKGLANYAFPKGGQGAAAGAARVGGGFIAGGLRRGFAGYMAHEGLSWLDPDDRTGAWIDRNIPGASWLDNQASRIGLGRSYAEQRQLEVRINPAPVYLDGKKVADAMFDVEVQRARQDMRSQGSWNDPLAYPQYPGMATGH